MTPLVVTVWPFRSRVADVVVATPMFAVPVVRPAPSASCTKPPLMLKGPVKVPALPPRIRLPAPVFVRPAPASVTPPARTSVPVVWFSVPLPAVTLVVPVTTKTPLPIEPAVPVPLATTRVEAAPRVRLGMA